MNHYELVVILTPVLSDEDLKSHISGYGDFIKNSDGEIVHQETWGLKQLAYPIDKKTTGIYHLWEFKAPAEFIDKLELQFRRDDRIMRFLTTRLDKYAIEYSESRRKKMAEAKSGKTEKVKEEA